MVLKRSWPAVSHCSIYSIMSDRQVQSGGTRKLCLTHNLQFNNLPIKFHGSDFLHHRCMLSDCTRMLGSGPSLLLSSKDHLQSQHRWWICSSPCRYRPVQRPHREQSRWIRSVASDQRRWLTANRSSKQDLPTPESPISSSCTPTKQR